MSQALSRPPPCTLTRTTLRLHGITETAQHAFGMIGVARFGDGRLTFGITARRAAGRISPGHCAPASGNRFRVIFRPPRSAMAGRPPSAVAIVAPMARSRNRRDTRLHGRLAQRFIANQFGIERLARENAGHEPHGSAGIAHVERLCFGAFNPCRPTP